MVSAKVNPEETKSNSGGDNPGATDRNLEVGGRVTRRWQRGTWRGRRVTD